MRKMGKASKWLRTILGLSQDAGSKCWGFVKYKNNTQNHDLKKQVIAAANAQTTATETTNTNYGSSYLSRSSPHFWAAVKIQSHFRAYLSRRALRALKSLVKLQALVRGHIVRKQTADNIRRVHALLRVQARALARRSKISESQPIFYNHTSSRNYSSSGEKIVDGQVFDPEKKHISPKRRNNFHSSNLSLSLEKYSESLTTSKESAVQRSAPNMSRLELRSLEHLNIFQHHESGYYDTLTAATSRSIQGGFSEHPNYMSFTKSSKAKMRSFSAPKQRMQISNEIYHDFRFSSKKVSELQAKFANKLYPGSGRL